MKTYPFIFCKKNEGFWASRSGYHQHGFTTFFMAAVLLLFKRIGTTCQGVWFGWGWAAGSWSPGLREWRAPCGTGRIHPRWATWERLNTTNFLDRSCSGCSAVQHMLIRIVLVRISDYSIWLVNSQCILSGYKHIFLMTCTTERILLIRGERTGFAKQKCKRFCISTNGLKQKLPFLQESKKFAKVPDI